MSDDFDIDPSPSESRLRRGPCGKACYASAQAAKRGYRNMDNARKQHGYKGRLHVYFCKPCRAFHVGHH